MAIGCGIFKYLAAEHILLVFSLAYGTVLPTRIQYIERRMAEELGVTNFSKSGSPCSSNKSSAEYLLLEQVQQKSSTWLLYIIAALAFSVLISVNSWGSLSDKYGRYVAFVVPCIGLTVGSVINILVIKFELSLWLMVASSALQGILGDLSLLVVGCSGYVSDVTIPESFERTVRFFLIDFVCLFASSVGQIAVGYLIVSFGFEAPYLLTIGLMAVYACLIIFTVPDRRITSSADIDCDKAPPNVLNVFKTVYHLFHQDKARGWLLAGYNFIIAALMLVIMSLPGISVLYTTGEPFCMGPVDESYYLGVVMAVPAIGTLIGGLILAKFLSKFWILHLSSALAMFYYLLTAFAQNYLMLYIGAACALLLFMGPPLSRVSMANLTGPHEQGVVFAFSSCTQGVFSFISPLIFNAIYSSTLHFMSGFVFLTFALINVFSWIVISLLHIFEPKQRRYETLSHQGEQISDGDDKTA